MIHILHHANCADGFAAACIARLFYFNAVHPLPLRLQPVNYPDAVQMPPNLEPGDKLIYVDYTPPEPVLATLTPAGVNPDLLVIDHHKTAAAVHDKMLHAQESVFDVTHSGAALTWRHFFQSPLPRAVELIEWRDLGHAFQPEHADDPRTEASHNLHAYLMRCLPRSPEAWTPLLAGTPACIKSPFAGSGASGHEIADPHELSNLQVSQSPNLATALHIGKKMKVIDGRIIDAAVNSPYWLDFHGEEIPALNGLEAGLISDGMNALLKAYPTAPFAASWYVDPATGQTVYSLRSRKGGPDVGAIAKALAGDDGGGHPNAAGFHTRNPIPFV